MVIDASALLAILLGEPLPVRSQLIETLKVDNGISASLP